MKFLLSDEVQVEVYAKTLNLTTRATWSTTSTSGGAARPGRRQGPRGRSDAVHATFFEQINSPQGPWLQMLQRAYYTEDDIDTIIADAKTAMKAIASQ